MKFESDRSSPLKVMISQTQEFGKAIRPFFADPVTFVAGWMILGKLVAKIAVFVWVVDKKTGNWMPVIQGWRL